MSSLQYLEVVFCFLSLTELTSFLCWVLCCEVFKFWVNSFDGLWNKEWQEPKLGYAHGTPKIIQGHQKVKAWGCPGRHPLFRPLPSVIYLELYFYSPTWYVFCLERLVLFVSLLVSLPQSSLLYTPFERAIHELEFDRILYVLHLDLVEHGGGFVLKKLLISHASLKLFWES